MDRDTALSKVKKCLALSKSANPHEAAAALRQAQKLMAEHGLSDDDLQLSDVGAASTKAGSVVITTWESSLTRMVADAFGCEVISSIERFIARGCQVKRRRQVVFIGMASAQDVAAYAYDVLLRQVLRDRRAHMAVQPKACKPATRVARGDAFAAAWVCGVADLVDRLAGSPRRTELLEAYLARQHPNLAAAKVKDRTLSRNVKDGSYSAGFAAGRKAQLDRGVAGPLAQGRLQ